MEPKELEIALSKHLTEIWSTPVKVSDWKALSGGACQDNASISMEREGISKKAVLRSDKGASLLSSLSKKEEFSVAKALFAQGVKVPEPIFLEESNQLTGSPFFIMEWIPGNAQGRYIVKDPELNAYRKSSMAKDLAVQLAKIHSIHASPEMVTDLPQALNFIPKDKYVGHCIADLRKSLESIPEAHPAIELCLNWLQKNQPIVDEIVLVHGDYRTGNFMITPEGLQGILDFEFAHWGDRYEDLSWICLRDWRFGKRNKEAGGFASRSEFFSFYESESQKKLDLQKARYWEIMGNVRWAIGSAQQAERHLSGKDKGIELLAIGRRTAEMEWEAMRLIEESENAV